MAPNPTRKLVAKDRFPALFSTLKSQAYHDPASRGPGSHTFVIIPRSVASPKLTYFAASAA